MKVFKNALWTAAGLVALAALTLAPAATADQQILDDLIVDGSICVGQDCVNGESFGFDTIRIKENNLRIRAVDTSNTASFPTNDWQITFNDSSNGGANKFSIDDIDGGRTPFTIEAGAPSHSLYVDDGGRIGFGTSTPVVDLHVKSGNTPTLRLEQDGTSGFAPQTWDLAGNETNLFIRDATNGSKLPFRIRPNSPTSSIDVFPGKVEFKGSSGGDLNLKATRGADSGDFVEFTFQEGTTDQWGLGNFGEADQFYVFNYVDGSYGMSIEADNDFGMGCRTGNDHDLTINSGNSNCVVGTFSQIDAGETAFVASSSRSIKENLEPVEVDGLLDKISEIDAYTYDFIDGKKDAIGLMAEDFHQIFGRGSDKTLSGHEMQVALWLAVQELTAKNEALTERLAAFESRLEE